MTTQTLAPAYALTHSQLPSHLWIPHVDMRRNNTRSFLNSNIHLQRSIGIIPNAMSAPPQKEPNRLKAIFSKVFKRNHSPHDFPDLQHDVGTAPVNSSPSLLLPLFGTSLAIPEDDSSEQTDQKSPDQATLCPSELTDTPPLSKAENCAQPTSLFSSAVFANPDSSPEPLIETAGASSTSALSPSDSAHALDAAKLKSASLLKHVGNGLVTVLRVIERSADTCPPLKSAVGGLVACIELTKSVEGNHEDYTKLINDLKMLAEEIQPDLSKLLEGDTSGSFARIVKSIDEEVQQIFRLQGRNTAIRIIEAQQDKDRIVDHYRRIVNLFQRVQCNVGLRTWEATMRLSQAFLLERLSPVGEARYNSSYSTTVKRRGCTPETRKTILEALCKWARDPNGARVYWMNGMAGTGKTTILYSLCVQLAEEHLLGANYFCSRVSIQCRDVNTIVPTLAYQLAHYSSAFRSELCKVLEKEPDASKLYVGSQLEKLIQEPLRHIAHAIPEDIVIAVDALDECEDGSAMILFLRALLNIADSLPIKFFITSRPDPTIREKIRVSSYSNSILHLHDIEESIVKADIEVYLTEVLTNMTPPPTSFQLRSLAERAGKLFIFAATAVRYISPEDPAIDSMDRLQRVLESTSSATKHYKEVDALYESILSAACDRSKLENDEVDRVLLMIRTVVCAKEPMAVQTLASVLGITEYQVRVALQPLASVLHVEDGAHGLVAPFHTSFPDFIFDQQRSHHFYCNKRAHAAILAAGSFNVMKTHLRFNICRLESSFIFDKDVPDLEDKVKSCIPASLSYASRFWADHLVETEMSDALHPNLIDFLSNRLLFWMEVLNLTDHISIAGRSLQRVLHWLGGADSEDYFELQNLLSDAEEFATRFAGGACKQSTPHIYISLLSFCRRDSSVYMNYWRKTRGLIDVKGRVLEKRLSSEICVWHMKYAVKLIVLSPDGEHVACRLEEGGVHVLNVHSGNPVVEPFLCGNAGMPVTSMVFSPDGKLVAVVADNAVYIWDPFGGATVAVLEHEAQCVVAATFSLDGSKIVTGSSGGKIQLWDARNGQAVGGAFGINSSGITIIRFSPAGGRLLSASEDGSIAVWDVSNDTPASPRVLRHSGRFLAISFPQNGRRLAAIWQSDTIPRSDTIRIWDISSGELITEREIHETWTAKFSRDGALYACEELDDITVWATLTGARVAGPFQRHTDGINTFAFSPDGRRILTGSYDQTIRIWDISSNQTSPSTSPNSTSNPAVAFFPNGRKIVQGGETGRIQVWDIFSGKTSSGTFEGHEEPVSCVAVSPDGRHIASSSWDKTVRLWVAKTGLAYGKPFQHTSFVNSVAFSPDGHHIISGSKDMTVRMWNVDGGNEVARLYHGSSVNSVTFSPDGMRIATGTDGSDDRVCIWDVKTCQTVVGPLLGHTNSVTSVAFLSDGSRLVSCSTDHTVRVWDAHSGNPIGDPFIGHTSSVQTVTFSPDGQYIASGSRDKTIYIWESFSGTPVAKLRGHTDLTWSIAFSPNGHQLISGSTDGTTRAWDMPKVLQSASSHALVEELPENFPDDAQITVEEDGWVYADGSPFCWYPPFLRTYLPLPSLNTVIFSCYGAISVDYHNLLIGEKWTDCNRSL